MLTDWRTRLLAPLRVQFSSLSLRHESDHHLYKNCQQGHALNSHTIRQTSPFNLSSFIHFPNYSRPIL
jgi:hypothetical protein